MLNKIYKTCFFATIIMLPLITYGALEKTSAFFTNAKDLITNILTPIAFTLALLFFFYGVAKYIWSAGGEKEEGKKIMVWGVIALFVMSSIWGIVTVLRSDLGIGAETAMPTPTFQ